MIVCPKCHGRLVGLSPIINTETTEIYGYYGYCPSLKCKVRRVTLDKNYRVISFTEWKNLDKKKKFLYESLKSSRLNGSYMYRKITQKKWDTLNKKK